MVFEEFIQLTAEAQKTKQIYRQVIGRWTKFGGFDHPDQLIHSIKEGKTDPYTFLQGIVAKQKSDNKAPITILQSFYTMKKFIEWETEQALNGIRLEKIAQTLPNRRVVSTDSAPTDTEVMKLIHHSNLRGRVTLILALTTGMRAGEMAATKLEWIDFDSDPVRITIPATATKTKTSRTVFTTSECADLVKQLIGERKTGALFPSLDPTMEYDETKPTSPSAMSNMFSRYLEKCDLRDKITPDSPMHRLHIHSLRKWFYSKAISCGMAPNYVELLLGHNIGLDQHYLRADLEKLASEYKKIEPSLTFLGAANGETRATVQRQQTELEQMRLENTRMRSQLDKIAEQQDRMTEFFKKNATVLGTVRVPDQPKK